MTHEEIEDTEATKGPEHDPRLPNAIDVPVFETVGEAWEYYADSSS